MTRWSPLRLELLEDRYAPATFGVPWPDPTHLTLSFVPDGTSGGDQTSELFRLLDGRMPRAVWQEEILRAAQTWAANANINIRLVPDDGEPLGAAGPPQGAPGFGDIRVAAVPMTTEVMAIGTPFDVTAGTWAGAIRFNSNYTFGVGGAGDVDLDTAAVHEMGHALGLPENPADPNSVMSGYFGKARTGLAPEDISAIQALYGPRQPDAYDSNQTLATAARIPSLANSPAVVEADIAAPKEADFYQFNTAPNTHVVTVQLQAAEVSLLTARLTVFDQNGEIVDSAVAPDPLHADLTIAIDKTGPNCTYYVEVEGGTDSVFGVGGYQLVITPDLNHPDPSAPNPTTPGGNVFSTNDSFDTAANLQPKFYREDGRFSIAVSSTISDSSDVDYFQFRSPKAAADGTTNALTVMLWGLEAGGLYPHARLFRQVVDPLTNQASYEPVPATVLVNDDGTYVLQLPQAEPNAQYFLQVRADQPVGPHNVGDYFLAIDFSPPPTLLQSFVSGTLSASHPQDTQTLQVNQSQLFHFVLTTDTPDGSVPAAVAMTVYDQAGNIVPPTLLQDAEAVSKNYFFTPGIYTFRFTALPAGPLPAPLTYHLDGLSLSDPIGPQPDDPTLAPVTASSAPQTPSFAWQPQVNTAFISLQDPVSDPQGSAGPAGATCSPTTVAVVAPVGPQPAPAPPLSTLVLVGGTTLSSGILAPPAPSPASTPAVTPPTASLAPSGSSFAPAPVASATPPLTGPLSGSVPDSGSTVVRLPAKPEVTSPSVVSTSANPPASPPVLVAGVNTLVIANVGAATAGTLPNLPTQPNSGKPRETALPSAETAPAPGWSPGAVVKSARPLEDLPPVAPVPRFKANETVPVLPGTEPNVAPSTGSGEQTATLFPTAWLTAASRMVDQVWEQTTKSFGGTVDQLTLDEWVMSDGSATEDPEWATAQAAAAAVVPSASRFQGETPPSAAEGQPLPSNVGPWLWLLVPAGLTGIIAARNRRPVRQSLSHPRLSDHS